eukprot:185154-Hanusia_phi.AAC.8
MASSLLIRSDDSWKQVGIQDCETKEICDRPCHCDTGLVDCSPRLRGSGRNRYHCESDTEHWNAHVRSGRGETG